MAKEKIENKNETKVEPENQLASYLKQNEGDHYNFSAVTSPVVSSSSLILDCELEGGMRQGIFRFSGSSGTGKSSCALAFMKNCLDVNMNSRGVYLQAERILSEQIKRRSGITFIEKPEDWKNQTCFIYKSNIFESVIGLMRKLVKENQSNFSYFFIIDSLDSLESRKYLDSEIGEAAAPAGAKMTADFLKKMSLAMASLGHYCILISQYRTPIKMALYEKTDPKLTNASGGHSANHYPDALLEFQQIYNKDIIWKGEEGKSDRIGHFCKVIFRKLDEKTGKQVQYPIKYGQTNGNSVWKEYELVDLLSAWDLISRKGAWYNASQELIKELDSNKIKCPEQLNGINAWRNYLTDNQELVVYLTNKFKQIYATNKS